jgi:hypothetical protein
LGGTETNPESRIRVIGHPNLDHENPIQKWWFTNNQLFEIHGTPKFAKENDDQYVDGSDVPIRYRDAFTFAIVSISVDNQTAVLYSEFLCPLCGEGILHYLKRSPSGEWWIYKSIGVWIS